MYNIGLTKLQTHIAKIANSVKVRVCINYISCTVRCEIYPAVCYCCFIFMCASHCSMSYLINFIHQAVDKYNETNKK